MIKTVLLIPMRDNDGQPFPPSAWQALEDRLLVFGGLSWQDGVHGVWEAAGRVYRDESRQYTVSLTSWREFPSWLNAVEWARDQFRQIALYIEVVGVSEILGAIEDPPR
jgi:hypothetical protein